MKAIFKILAILLMLSFMSAMAVRYYYTRQMPESPQVAVGRTIPVGAFYGKIVYVTLSEKRKLEFVYTSFGGIGIIFAGFTLWATKTKRLKF